MLPGRGGQDEDEAAGVPKEGQDGVSVHCRISGSEYNGRQAVVLPPGERTAGTEVLAAGEKNRLQEVWEKGMVRQMNRPRRPGRGHGAVS